MKTLLISLVLYLPIFDKHDSWEVNQVPNQLQIYHDKECLVVSYPMKPVKCDTVPESWERLLKPDSEYMPVCYLVLDIKKPKFVKSCQYNKVEETYENNN